VNKIANQATTTAMTAPRASTVSTMMCGMARNHLTRRQPTVEAASGVGIVDLQVDRLLLLGGGVPLGEQRRIRADPCREATELQREVEPPAGVPPAEEDHQHGRREQRAADAASGSVELGDDLPVVVMTVTVDVAWAVSTERTMAIGMIQISRNAVVTRSRAPG
jgi:hypothetical protein